MLDKEQAKSALIEHLAASSAWDDESDELARKFGRAMIEDGTSESAAIEELQSVGIPGRSATQIVASIIGETEPPTEPRTRCWRSLRTRFLLSLGMFGLGVFMGFLALGMALSGSEASPITSILCVGAACVGVGGIVGLVMFIIELLVPMTVT